MALSESQTLKKSLDDDHDWRVRSELWHRRTIKSSGRRAKRERRREPLILCGHGVSLRTEGGSLTIRNGLTHYPQKQETYHFFEGGLELPTRLIMIDGSGSLSFDVLSWLSEQRVTMIRINWKGDVSSIISSTGYAANPFRTKWQIETRENPTKR